jgi:hypothetical protein
LLSFIDEKIMPRTIFLDPFSSLHIREYLKYSHWITYISMRNVRVLNFLPRDGYQDDVELIHWRESKQLIKRNVRVSMNKLHIILIPIFW